jgi:hypothetical protein
LNVLPCNDVVLLADRAMQRPNASRLPRSTDGFLESPVLTKVETYEDRLNRNKEWAMDEGDRFFQGASETHKALKRITQKLGDLGIDYVVVGGMAMFQHGYRRFTEDVDLLVTREGLKEIHRNADGLGCLTPFYRSKNLRDTESGVKIEFLVTGEYPGDRKPKPFFYPTPADVAEEIRGIRCISLPALVELKLASGMSDTERMKDLADVLEMIKVLDLPREFSERLNPFMEAKFKQLWDDAHPLARRYLRLWPRTQSAAAMLADGVTIVARSGTADDYVYLVTADPAVAKKYDMHDETEFLNDEDFAENRSNGNDAIE